MMTDYRSLLDSYKDRRDIKRKECEEFQRFSKKQQPAVQVILYGSRATEKSPAMNTFASLPDRHLPPRWTNRYKSQSTMLTLYNKGQDEFRFEHTSGTNTGVSASMDKKVESRS